MDQFTRRVIGFAVQAGVVDGPALCRMFNHASAGEVTLPQHLSSDHDPLFEFHRWKANLRILEVTKVETVPHVPVCDEMDSSCWEGFPASMCQADIYLRSAEP